jgi:DUF4097 and DUF4098 domain-containing protein YvlB
MKPINLFTRFLVALVFTAITSLALAAYSAKKAYDTDPQLIAKLEEKYNINVNTSGIVINDFRGGESTQDQWQLTLPQKRILLKAVSGNIAIKSSTGQKIQIMATGMLNKNKSPRLLDVTESTEDLVIREPENAVENLEVRIEIPKGFEKDIEVSTVSGNISLENIKVNLAGIKTVSGNLMMKSLDTPRLILESVSGDSKIHDSTIKDIAGKSVSGEIEIESKGTSGMDLKSISGDVKLKLPKTSTVQLEVKTVSGEVRNEHQKTANHTANASPVQVHVSTTSGDIEIE